jgi:hypothetical protein
MKRTMILGVLFFGGVWGVSEVFVGEALYRADFPHASVPLTLIALAVLTVARVRFPAAGSSTAIGASAALYKLAAMLTTFLGTPVFLCHLVGIVSLGLAYDLAFSALKRKGPAALAAARAGYLAAAVRAAAATYVAYALFALAMTFVFRYGGWPAGGWEKVLRHVGVSGTLAALGGAVLVPAVFRVAAAVRGGAGLSVGRSRLAAGGVCLATLMLWVVGIVVAP